MRGEKMSDDIRNIYCIIQRNEIRNCVSLLMSQGWPKWNYTTSWSRQYKWMSWLSG